MAQLRAGRTVLRLGNITAKRDFIHAADAAAGFAAAATSGACRRGDDHRQPRHRDRAFHQRTWSRCCRGSPRATCVEVEESRLRSSDNPVLVRQHPDEDAVRVAAGLRSRGGPRGHLAGAGPAGVAARAIPAMKVLAAVVLAPHWEAAGGFNAALRLSTALAKICDIDLARWPRPMPSRSARG